MGNFTSKIISFNHRKCKCKHHTGVTFNNNNNNNNNHNNNHNHNVNCNHNVNHNNDSNYGKLFQSIVVKDKEVVSNDLVHLDHHIMREVWQSNFSSPVDDILKEGGAKVLDVGCGLGAWLCEISISYPKSQFTGIDILSIFPTIKPFNVNFMQSNVLEGLPFEDNTFDFVHIRGLVYDLTESQWLNIVYQELLRVLKPGGWLEIADAETKGTSIGPLNEFFNDSIINNAISGNVNPRIVDSHYSNLHSVICNINNNSNEKIVIHHLKRRCPVGKWGGKLGEATLIFVIGSIRNYYINLKTKNTLKLYKSFINSSNENAAKYRNKEIKNYEELLELQANEFETYKSFFNYHRFYYQKK